MNKYELNNGKFIEKKSDDKNSGQCKNLRGNICKNPIFA